MSVRFWEMEGDEEETERWVNNCYSSSHQILLVGEGDFSFSLSLALFFSSAFNILATSLDDYDTLMKKYKRAKSNLEKLMKLGASVIHGVDATKMKLYSDLKMLKFDRIVYNFPHAGFHGKEDDPRLIKKHRILVDGFFRNASHMLRPDGEIHVRHKTSAPFCDWNINQLASHNSLLLIESVPFKIDEYPGYNNKRGDGLRSDAPFPLGQCKTFKFIFSNTCKKVYPSKSFGILVPPVNDNRFKREEFVWIFDRYLCHATSTYGLPEERIDHNVHEALNQGYERFVQLDPQRPSNDFTRHLEELRQLSLSRIQWLEQRLAGWHC